MRARVRAMIIEKAREDSRHRFSEVVFSIVATKIEGS